MAAQYATVERVDGTTVALGGERAGGGLPAPLTSFLGREEVIAGIVRLLDDPAVRLLTLTGPGGVGKTRLAIEVAHRVKGDFADGACFVPLAPVGDPTLILPTIAHALGIATHPLQPLWDTIGDALRSRHLLLILDNYEHLLTEPPAWLGEMMSMCPRVTLLVTSQVALHIGGEQRFEVPPLGVPHRRESDAAQEELPDAVALFEQRARALKPEFSVTAANRADIERICRQVDGLPLAIELSASRILFLGPSEIARHLTNRLRLLTGGQRNLPPRLQSMRNAIAWSHDLLDPDERRLFRRLAIFVDGFTLEAAEAVCPDTTDERVEILGRLAALLDHSLIRRGDEGDQPRFAMLEVIREFGIEQLAESGELDTIRDRHADWCLTVAARVEPEPQHRSQPDLAEIARFEDDYGNVRSALEWLDAAGRYGDLALLVIRLRSFWYLTDRYGEALRWMQRLLALDRDPGIEVLRLAGTMAQLVGDSGADRYLDAALDLALESGDTYQLAEVLFHLGILHEDRGSYDRAEELFVEARERYQQVDNDLGLLQSDYHLGVVAYGQNRLGEAKRRFRQITATAEAAGDRLLPIWSYNYLVLIACDEGDVARAVDLLKRQAEVLAAPALRHHVPDFLATAGVLAATRSQPHRAARLLGASGRSPYSLTLPERASFERAIETARESLGRAAFDREFGIGRRLTNGEVSEELARLFGAGDEPKPREASGREPRADDSDLSTRELEVLRLLADGLTNQEIGDRLFVSPRTVATHMDHILTKLDVRSRTAAVAYAIRNGLA